MIPLELYTPTESHTWARILPCYQDKKNRTFLGLFGVDGIGKPPKPGDIARIDYDVYRYLNLNPNCYNMVMEDHQGFIVWQGAIFGDELEFLSSQEVDEHEAKTKSNRQRASTRMVEPSVLGTGPLT